MVYIYSNLNSHLYMDGDLFTYSFLYVFSLIVFAIPKQIIFFQQEAIHGAIGGFTTAFTTHVKNNDKANLAKAPEKRSKARAASKVSGPAAMRLADAFKNSLGDLLPVPVPDANMELSYFGVQAGSVTASSEKGWSGSLRLATSGTKTILCLAASTMHGFAGNVNPATYWDTLLNVDKTSYEADLVKALYAGTLGPLDALFLPCGWLFAESVMGDGDLCGFAFRGVSSRNNESYNELQLVRKLLHAHNRSDSELEAAVNHLQTVLPNPHHQQPKLEEPVQDAGERGDALPAPETHEEKVEAKTEVADSTAENFEKESQDMSVVAAQQQEIQKDDGKVGKGKGGNSAS